MTDFLSSDVAKRCYPPPPRYNSHALVLAAPRFEAVGTPEDYKASS